MTSLPIPPGEPGAAASRYAPSLALDHAPTSLADPTEHVVRYAALADALRGVDLGTHDLENLTWIAAMPDPAVRTLVSWLERVRAAGTAEHPATTAPAFVRPTVAATTTPRPGYTEPPTMSGYTERRRLPVRAVHPGDLVATVTAEPGIVEWLEVVDITRCDQRFCPIQPQLCAGVLTYRTGAVEHVDISLWPNVRIPVDPTAPGVTR